VYSQADTSDIARSVNRFKSLRGAWSLAMYIHSSIRTAFGLRRLPSAPMVRVSLTRRELDSLIHALDRDAMHAELDGRFAEADSIAVRAIVLRDAVR
jgi:hypothetical protein